MKRSHTFFDLRAVENARHHKRISSCSNFISSSAPAPSTPFSPRQLSISGHTFRIIRPRLIQTKTFPIDSRAFDHVLDYEPASFPANTAPIDQPVNWPAASAGWVEDDNGNLMSFCVDEDDNGAHSEAGGSSSTLSSAAVSRATSGIITDVDQVDDECDDGMMDDMWALNLDAEEEQEEGAGQFKMKHDEVPASIGRSTATPQLAMAAKPPSPSGFPLPPVGHLDAPDVPASRGGASASTLGPFQRYAPIRPSHLRQGSSCNDEYFPFREPSNVPFRELNV